MSERELWSACCEYIRNGGDAHGFQQFWAKLELLKIYPYLLSWEVYNFVKYGYDGLYVCKQCGEQITKLHETEFCSTKCKGVYKTNEYSTNIRLLWDDAKKLCCENKHRKSVKNVVKDYNPVTILAKMYNMEPRYIFEYLVTGNDHYDKKPAYKPYEYKSWEDIMGAERAAERKANMIKRQTGKKHPQEWIDKQKAWYRDEENMKSFKEIIKYTSSSSESQAKQREGILRAIESGRYTPKHNGRQRGRGIYFDNIHFRSRFELIYYAYNKYVLQNDIQFEKFRIPYFDTKKQKNRIYITDFYNKTTNEIIEIKPKAHIYDELKDKLVGVAEYVKTHGVKYKIITEATLKKYLNALLQIEDISTNDVFKDIAKRYAKWIER